MLQANAQSKRNSGLGCLRGILSTNLYAPSYYSSLLVSHTFRLHMHSFIYRIIHIVDSSSTQLPFDFNLNRIIRGVVERERERETEISCACCHFSTLPSSFPRPSSSVSLRPSLRYCLSPSSSALAPRFLI